MLIGIETKANMSEKALQILEDLKDLLFESISVKDEDFITKQKELHTLYNNIKSGKEKLLNEDEYQTKMTSFWKIAR